MANDARVIQTPQGWFVETPGGNFGPMDSEYEANTYLSLMIKVSAAGSETACTEAECSL